MREPIDHPAAWSVTPDSSRAQFTVDLESRHVDALCRALEHAKRRGRTADDVALDDFSLAAIGKDVQAWREEVRTGRGMVLLRGFPLDGYDTDDIGLMYVGLGLHFGLPVSQSPMGDRLGQVVNVGGQDARERAYRSARELSLHTDRCDHVGMLCLQPAWRGGVSGYASALTIHNHILAERPELLEPLYNGFYLHRFGQQPPGEPPISRMRVPVFSAEQGAFNVVYIRGYIKLADEEGLAPLSDLEREALDYFDAVAGREDVRLNFTLQRGELAFFNNCLLLHTRTAFEDDPDGVAPPRHLMRLWLMEEGRPVTEAVRGHKNIEGIRELPGRGTYYAA